MTSLSPPAGSVSGNIVVTVAGTGFEGRDILCRWGGGHHVAGSARLHGKAPSGATAESATSLRLPTAALPLVTAKVISDTVLECVAPQSSEEGPRPVELSSNGGVDWSDSGVEFTYSRDAYVDTLEPHSGPEDGATSVAVHGANFVDSPLLACRFTPVALGMTATAWGLADAAAAAKATVPAVWMSHDEVRCGTPVNVRGAASVEITHDGLRFTASDIRFTFASPARVQSLFPAFGPAAGGTRVTLTGENFAHTDKLACRFGVGAWGTVPAVFLSSGQVVCTAPQHPVGIVVVEVTLNGQDWTSDGIQFGFAPTLMVHSMVPDAAPATGGTVILVRGSGFAAGFGEGYEAAKGSEGGGVPPAPGVEPLHVMSMSMVDKVHPTIACVLFPGVGWDAARAVGKAVRVPGQVLSDTALECVTPAHGLGSVTVEVTTNGQDISDAQAQLVLFAPPYVSSLWPAFAPELNAATHLQLRGANFRDVPGLQCVVRFRGYEDADAPMQPESAGIELQIRAAFVNSMELGCTLPPLAAAIYSVEVSVNGHIPDATADGFSVTMRHAMDILTITPTHGVTDGGTFVTLAVSNLPSMEEEKTVWCVFGGAIDHGGKPVEDERLVPGSGSAESAAPSMGANTVRVPGLVTSATTIQCVTPRTGTTRVSSLTLTVNDLHMVRRGALYTFHRRPRVARLAPSFGSSWGGTRVTVTGDGFFMGDKVQCRFGDAAPVDGTVINATAIECVTPPAAGLLKYGPAPVQVTLNGQDYSQDGQSFNYVYPPLLTSLTPLTGTEAGGSVITVYGSRFQDAAAFACRFTPRRALGEGDRSAGGTVTAIVVPALWLNESVAQCVTPALPPGRHEVAVTNNGQEWTEDRITFVSLPLVFVTSVAPAIGPVAGGTPVHVHGTNFVANAFVRCRFGVVEVPATYLSSTEIICHAPAHGPGDVMVQVSTGEGDFSADVVSVAVDGTPDGASGRVAGAAKYTYAPPAVVHRVAPDSGPARGGTEVTVTGEHFLQGESEAGGMLCVFGTMAPVAATVLDDNTLTCVVPPLGALDANAAQGTQTVPLEVTTIAHETSHSGVQFRYLTPIALTTLFPTSGPELGGTRVRVTGYNFVSTSQLVCKFVGVDGNLLDANGDPPAVVPDYTPSTVVPATWLSPTTLECVSPTALPGTVFVEASNNARDFTSSRVPYRYDRAGAVRTVLPTQGPPAGGTMVTVTGTNFVHSGRLVCMFDATIVGATFVSDSEVLCPAPAHIAGVVAVEVASNGVDFTTDGTLYTYAATPAVTSISPLWGSAMGGSMVAINGQGFVDGTTMCRFGDAEPQLPASFEGSNRIVCVAPPAPRLFLGFVPVEITNNGQDFSRSGVAFQYQPQQVVTAVKPLSGPDTGGTVVSVFGVNFVASSVAACRFGAGTAPVSARWLSSSLLECVSPRSPPGSVALEVSNNGVDFSSDGVLFRFDPMAAVLRLEPSTGPITGSTAVTVHGNHFANEQTWCRFGVVVVPAVFISSTQLKCSTPPHEAGPVPVEVTNNRVDFTANSVMFEYARLPLVVAVDPFFGPNTGDTFVRVWTENETHATGADTAGFAHSPRTLCRIGDAIMPADVDPVTGAVLGCLLPPEAGVDATGPKGFSVDVSSNRIDWTTSNVPYKYVSPVSVTKVTPDRASSAGGETIIVAGFNFTNTATLACRFGSVVTRAMWLSPNEIRCTSPRHVKSKVLLSVTNNGVDWSASSVVFEFHQDAVVLTMEPVHGPVRGQTRVTVRGFNFVQSSLMHCKFGDLLEPMLEFVSSTEIVCMSPPRFEHAGSVSLEVTNNNASFSDNGEQYRYDARVNVAVLAPKSGSTSGGTRVLVHGSNFVETGVQKCRFGHSVVDAEFLNAGQLVCVSPPQAEGRVPLEVSLNGVDYSFSNAEFEYFEDVVIESIDPWRGNALRGRGVVTVRGSGFRNTILLACLFGGTLSQATWRDSTTVVCRIPPAMPGPVNFELTTNGVDFTSSGLQFLYDRDASVQKLYPNRGLHTGQVPVFVRGSNFVNSTSLKCKFGELPVRALFLTPKLVLCMAPSRVAGSIVVTGEMPVEVANNGADFTTSGVLYDYLERCPPRHYCPHLELLPCPNGTFCEGDSLFNFTMCQPGTFQPRMKMDQCLDCPLGYYCPDFGMSKPNICTPGFVCDELGLVSPTNPCPAGHWCPVGTKTGDPFDFYGDVRPDINATEWVLDEETGILTFDPNVRQWPILTRELPATGDFIIEHPPVAWDRDTGEMSAPLLAERPHPCPLGEFCRTGVSTNISVPKNFSTPQPCFKGFFCPRGSRSPEGKGPCPTGFYCPTTTEAFICSRGHYCPGVGNVRPIECYPGTYNPLQQQSNCTLCPPGHICPGWGRLEPAICPAGFVCIESALSEPVIQCPQGYYCPEGTLIMPFFDDLSEEQKVAADYADYLATANETDTQGRRLISEEALDWYANILRAQVIAALVSGINAPTYPTVLTTSLVPRQCPRGTFCLGGVAHPNIIEWKPADPAGATAPQLCTEGTFCERGTPSPAGSGSCYKGHYCPPGIDVPIQAPIGTFASRNGSVVPTMCFPGTYAPLKSTSNCRVCPAGYTCQSYGTYRPEICEKGTYRSLANSITCRLCPQGTWSQLTGLTSISGCEPCPAGRVCGIEKMFNLSESVSCPDGHICGEGTTKAKQFAHQCPAGYYCFEETAPADQFNFMCDPGHYCWRGTKGFLKHRNKCAVGYYCPRGTSDGFPEETRCPKGTTSRSGSQALTDCEVEAVNICDKKLADGVSYYPAFEYNFQGDIVKIDNGETETAILREINPVNESSSDPYWQNDTIDVYRACKSYVEYVDDPDMFVNITVIGLRYVDRPSLMCQVKLWEEPPAEEVDDTYVAPYDTSSFSSARPLIVPGAFLKQSRVGCSFPANHFSVGDILSVKVANDGFAWSTFEAIVRVVDASTVNDAQALQDEITCLTERGTEEIVPYDDLNQWYEVRGMSMAKISFDFTHLPDEFEYDWHYKIAIYVSDSVCTEEECDERRVRYEFPRTEHQPCTQPIVLSDWFLDRSVLKQDIVNISLLALEDIRFHLEMHVVYGLYLPLSWQLKNTSTVVIMNPTRTNHTFGVLGPDTRRLGSAISFEQREVTKDYSFLAVYERSGMDEVSPPLNLPKRFEAWERGRVLPMFNVSTEAPHVPWVLDEFSKVKPNPQYWEQPPGDLGELIPKYREIFHDSVLTDAEAGEYEYAFQTLVLPYMPFFSSCHGYDSYIPIFALLEDPACEMPEGLSDERMEFPPFPHPDDIFHVAPDAFLASPIADVCTRSFSCKYEEDLPQKDVTPRWMEVASGTSLFSIVREPLSLEDMFMGGELAENILAEQGSDVFIGMDVDRDAAESMKGECTRLCFPRTIDIEMTYYQFNPNLKRIISIAVVFDNFDRNTKDPNYQLSFTMTPLNYMELVVAFAFPQTTFIVLFCFVGGISTLFTFAYWIFHRAVTRLATPPKMRWVRYIIIVTPAPVAGVGMAMIPVTIVTMFIYFIIHGDRWVGDGKSNWLLDNWYGHFMMTKLDPKQTEHNRFGRVGLMFHILGWYLIIQGARIFLPKRVSKREREIELKRDKAAAKETVWRPTLWKRSNMVFTSLIHALFLTLIVEFSFWEDFGTYIWHIIVGLKFVAVWAEWTLEAQVKEYLLMCPLVTSMDLIQGLVTFGADDFGDFMQAYFIEFILLVAERIYIGPGTTVVVDFIMGQLTRFAIWLRGKLNLKRKLRIEAEAEKEGADADAMKQREIDLQVEGGETVEPILDAFAGYANETLALFYQPFMIVMMMLFRSEIAIPDLYVVCLGGVLGVSVVQWTDVLWCTPSLSLSLFVAQVWYQGSRYGVLLALRRRHSLLPARG